MTYISILLFGSIDLFKDVGQVVHVRLLVDCEGNQIGDGYVEFASSKEAEQVRAVTWIILSSNLKVPPFADLVFYTVGVAKKVFARSKNFSFFGWEISIPSVSHVNQH